MIHSSILAPKIRSVVVEFDGPRGARETREFRDDASARRFYARKSKEGRSPRIVRAAVS